MADIVVELGKSVFPVGLYLLILIIVVERLKLQLSERFKEIELRLQRLELSLNGRNKVFVRRKGRSKEGAG